MQDSLQHDAPEDTIDVFPARIAHDGADDEHAELSPLHYAGRLAADADGDAVSRRTRVYIYRDAVRLRTL